MTAAFSRGRILDVSERGLNCLAFKNAGTAKIRLEVLSEESRQVASMAKQGRDTRGTEIALNENKKLQSGRVTPQQSPPRTLAQAPSSARNSYPVSQTDPAYQQASYQSGARVSPNPAPVQREVLDTTPFHAGPQGRLLPNSSCGTGRRAK